MSMLTGEGAIPARRFPRGWVAAAASSAVLSAVLVLDVTRQTLWLWQDAREAAAAEAAQVARQIDQALQPAVARVRALAKAMEEKPVSEGALQVLLESAVGGEAPYLFEAGVAFAPYAWSPKIARYAPHFRLLRGEKKHYRREELGDYLHTMWFRSAMAGGLGWTDTEISNNSGELIVGVAAPFFHPGRPEVPAGVVRLNASIVQLRDTFSTFVVGRSQYGYLLSSMSTYVSHPIEQYVGANQTVFEVAGQRGEHGLIECVRRALSRGQGTTQLHSELTGRHAWVFCEPIPTTGWVLVLVSERAEAAVLPHALWWRHVQVMLSLLLAASLWTCILLRVHEPTPARLWAASLLVSFFLLGGLAFLWSRVSSAPMGLEPGHQEIFDRSGLERFRGENATLEQGLKQVPTRFVLAGLFLSTLRFSSSSEAVVTGHVWQRYQLGQDDGLQRGFIIPDAEQVSFQEAYRRRNEREEVVGWNFRATLRQQFSDTRRFPFDQAALRIRLWHSEFDRNIVLLPDLDGYSMLIPEARPGVDKDLTLSGWRVEQSFFSYERHSLNSNFGIQDFAGQGDAPRLSFTVVARRELIDPFFASLLPILGVSSILFILMMSMATDDKLRDRLGFKPMNALSVLAGTLFVVLVAQNTMRARVGANEIIFFELLYFVAYAEIILVACVAILSSRVKPLRFFMFQDGVLPKAAFWPLTLGAWLALSVSALA